MLPKALRLMDQFVDQARADFGEIPWIKSLIFKAHRVVCTGELLVGDLGGSFADEVVDGLVGYKGVDKGAIKRLGGLAQ